MFRGPFQWQLLVVAEPAVGAAPIGDVGAQAAVPCVVVVGPLIEVVVPTGLVELGCVERYPGVDGVAGGQEE